MEFNKELLEIGNRKKDTSLIFQNPNSYNFWLILTWLTVQVVGGTVFQKYMILI